MTFTHLHVHSEGSLLDGFGSAEDIVNRAKNLGQEAIALTDHGTMSQALKFHNAAKSAGVNPLIGMEAYIADDMYVKEKESTTYHMGIIARNNRGLEKLYKISYWAWNKGYYRKPRIDIQTYTNFYGPNDPDLFVLSGCLDGPISQNFLSEHPSVALRKCDELQKSFKYFAIEIQPWNPPELNMFLIDLADRKGIPLVVTADTHYVGPEDKANVEISLIINQLASTKASERERAAELFNATKKNPNLVDRVNLLWPNRRIRFDKYDNYIKSREDLKVQMDAVGITRDDMYDNTNLLTKDIDVEIVPRNYFPRFDKKLVSNDYLRDLAFDNLNSMGLGTEEYYDRLNMELRVVEKLNFSDYFLAVWDIIHFAQYEGIWTGPGRGSVGGSLLAYSLGITRIDPIKYNLLFFRFLNLEIDYETEFEEIV